MLHGFSTAPNTTRHPRQMHISETPSLTSIPHVGTESAWSHSALSPEQVSLQVKQQPVHALAISDGKEKTRKPIDPPPIVQIEVEDRADPHRHHLFSPHLFVLASLFPEGKEVATSRSQKDIVGERCSTIHRLKDRDDKEGGYFVFGDISVRKPGKYRLQFSLFNGDPSSNYIFLAETFSEFFTVYSAKDFQGMDESTGMSRSFNEQGVRLRMRKATRSRHHVQSYYPTFELDDQRQHHHQPQQYSQPDVYQQITAIRNYPWQSTSAMDDRGVKRQREEDHDALIPPPSQVPRTGYCAAQYPTSQSYTSMHLGHQDYTTHQQQVMPSTAYDYFGPLGGIYSDVFE